MSEIDREAASARRRSSTKRERASTGAYRSFICNLLENALAIRARLNPCGAENVIVDVYSVKNDQYDVINDVAMVIFAFCLHRVIFGDTQTL